MHRLHQVIHNTGGAKPPSGEYTAATEKAVKEAPTKRAREEGERRGRECKQGEGGSKWRRGSGRNRCGEGEKGGEGG